MSTPTPAQTQTLELVYPDRAASTWDEFFRMEGQEITPKIVSISRWGASVILNGKTYSADQDEMENYPNAGSYYLTRE